MAQAFGIVHVFVSGKPPEHGLPRLNLRHVEHPVFDRALRAREDLLSATIVLDKIEPPFLEYQAKGVVFYQALRTEPWGRRTFILA